MRVCAIYVKNRDSLVFMDFCGTYGNIELSNALTSQMFQIDKLALQSHGFHGMRRLSCELQNQADNFECFKSGNTYTVHSCLILKQKLNRFDK
jgi:hypothetical protein